MLMEQYSGRQKAYEEAVKFFTGGSKKYTIDDPPHTPSEKLHKWSRLNPTNPLPNERVIIAFGNAAMNYNNAGTLPISLQKFSDGIKSSRCLFSGYSRNRSSSNRKEKVGNSDDSRAIHFSDCFLYF